jgi:hypothetical protein
MDKNEKIPNLKELESLISELNNNISEIVRRL